MSVRRVGGKRTFSTLTSYMLKYAHLININLWVALTRISYSAFYKALTCFVHTVHNHKPSDNPISETFVLCTTVLHCWEENATSQVDSIPNSVSWPPCPSVVHSMFLAKTGDWQLKAKLRMETRPSPMAPRGSVWEPPAQWAVLVCIRHKVCWMSFSLPGALDGLIPITAT